MDFVSMGDDPACHELTLSQKLVIAWYRNLDEMERAALDLFVSALQEKHERLQRFEAHAILDNIQERHLLAA